MSTATAPNLPPGPSGLANKKFLLDAAMVLVGGAVAIWYFSIRPTAGVTEHSGLVVTLLAFAYPLVGMLVLLGITTVIDLIVFFFFTKPLVSWLAQFKFFSAGHKLSGFSAEQAGIDRIGAPRPAGGIAR